MSKTKRGVNVESELLGAFRQIEADFRAWTRDSYRAQASNEIRTWLDRFEREPVKLEECRDLRGRLDPWGFQRQFSLPHYVEFQQDPHRARHLSAEWSCPSFANQEVVDQAWLKVRELNQAGRFTANYERAEADAETSVDGARDFFLKRVGDKIRAAVGERPVNFITAKLEFRRGLVEGWLRVQVGKDHFDLSVQMVTNYRYEPRYLAYHQFPTRFLAACLNDQLTKNPSEAWMREHFAGETPAAPLPTRYVGRSNGRGWFVVIDTETDQVAEGTWSYRNPGGATRKANELNRALVGQ